METRYALLSLLFSFLFVSGCVLELPAGNNTNTSGNNSTIIPPGYTVKDYCERDSDCYRQVKCCDCGLGEYVNKYNLDNPICTSPRCLCPISDTIGKCAGNRCIATPAMPITPDNESKKPGFCGWSTNGTCAGDLDCKSGGCSNQVCQSVNEPSVVTTCIFSECFDARSYGVLCRCVNSRCSWE